MVALLIADLTGIRRLKLDKSVIGLLVLTCFFCCEACGEEDGNELKALPASVPAPPDNRLSIAKVELGKALFFDPRLSGDNKMSCSTCHLPEKAFGDGLRRAKGAGDKELSRNSQTLYNVGFYETLFWDGRAKSLEEQALIPIESPDEMNQNVDELVIELAAVPFYESQFKKVFGREVNKHDIAKAIASFQRTLVTPNSPFDRYLAGEKNALSSIAKQGLELFRGDAGCVRCHNGSLLSDGKFYRLGVGRNDEGRGAITKERADQFKFRTPSLRNVAETAPYMHDGSQATLFEVVQFYYRDVPTKGPGGLELDIEPLTGQSFSDIDAIVEFLKSLTGELPQVVPPKIP